MAMGMRRKGHIHTHAHKKKKQNQIPWNQSNRMTNESVIVYLGITIHHLKFEIRNHTYKYNDTHTHTHTEKLLSKHSKSQYIGIYFSF